MGIIIASVEKVSTDWLQPIRKVERNGLNCFTSEECVTSNYYQEAISSFIEHLPHHNLASDHQESASFNPAKSRG